MGLLDHQKTWRFVVKAAPQECERAFTDAMTKSPAFKMHAGRWTLRRAAISSPGRGTSAEALIATYEGRAGIAGFVTGFASRAQAVEQVAIGSEMAFVVEEATADRTTCAMYMKQAGTRFGLTGDAGYFRSYMNDVEGELRTLDAQLRLRKE